MNVVDFGASPIPALEDLAVRINGPIVEGPPDIFPGFLPKQGELLIAGATNIGKSLLGIEICSSFITGKPLWGDLAPTYQAKKILYILGEHYVGVIQRLAQLTKLPIPDSVYLLGPEHLGYDKWIVSGGRPNIHGLSKFRRWAEGCDLIVWDPLSSFCTGIDVENDNVQMRLVLDSMTLVSQEAGASCVVLSHMGKPQIGPDGKEFARKSYAVRGASAIEDAATNIFYMDRARGESQAAQRAADGEIFSLTCRKYKGVAPPEYRLLRNPDTLTHTLLGNRPFVELKRLVTQSKLGKLLAGVDGLDRDGAIRILAALQDCDERTIRRDLGMG